ncbi:MAG TPA: hypothetical protein VKE49_07995 [Myxococcaceae bacterium]|nr:hypothetical protein [Myxococcaceae bacterium]
MSLLPEGASLEEMVQECFFAYRGSGLSLSALDAELLSHWAHSGAPFSAIAFGIRRAAENAAWHARPGEPPLRSLRACRRQVEAEIRRHLWRSAGATGKRRRSRPREAKLKKELARLALDRPELKAAVASLQSALEERRRGLEEADTGLDLIEARLLRALPFPERLGLLKEARSHTRALGGQASARARVLARRFQRAVALRNKLALPAFW